MGLIVKFETAKLAKRKGFVVVCRNSFNEQGEFLPGIVSGNEMLTNENEETLIAAPTQAELQTWLRDRHMIHCEITAERSINLYCGRIKRRNTNGILQSSRLIRNETYELTLEQTLINGLICI